MQLKLIAALGLAFLVACGSGGGGGTPDELEAPQAASPVGYGLANHWHEVDAHAFGASLRGAGLNLTVIELQPWFTVTGPGCKHDGGLSDQVFPLEAKEFVDAMRAHNITTVVIGVNANNCKAKTWPAERFEALNSFVLGLGVDRVWYLPVNEPWAMDFGMASRWVGSARRTWTGKFLVADNGRNSASGHPYFGVVFDLTTANACSDSAAKAGLQSKLPVLVTTDCTGVLNPGPERAAALAQDALTNGTALVIYDFRGTQPDQAVIAAIGSVVRGAS